MSEVRVIGPGDPYGARNIVVRQARGPRPAGQGRRRGIVSLDSTGTYERAKMAPGRVTDPAVDATLRAAAPFQKGRHVPPGRAMAVHASDLRQKVRVRRAGLCIMFVLDASGSMHQRQRMAEAKAAVLSLLAGAYRSRDRVGLVSFRGQRAEVVLPITGSIDLARARLAGIPSGGRTPLAEGMRTAREALLRERTRQPGCLAVMIVISDGKANVSRTDDPVAEALAEGRAIGRARIPFLFVDTDMTWEDPGLGMKLCDVAGGRYVGAGALDAGRIIEALELHVQA